MMTCTKIKESCDVCKMANDTAESFENCDTRFKKFAKIFSETLKQNEQLKDVIKTLNEDLELCRTTSEFLKTEILNKLSSDEVQTEGQYISLLKKINDLERENTVQKEEQTKQEKKFEEEKLKLLDELEKQKMALAERETKLTNDLQLANNLAAIQYDDLELRMQQQIETLLTQLKEEKNTCHMLRGEVFSLKQRLAYNNSEERIQRLEEKLRVTEDQLKKAQEQKSNVESNLKAVHNQNKIHSSSASTITYEKDRFANPIAYKTNVVFNQCYMTEKQATNIKRQCNRSGTPIPPLIQVDQFSPAPPRKRKLFNPDDLRYLDDINEQE